MGKPQRLKTRKRKPLRKRNQVGNKFQDGQLHRKTFEPKHKSEIELRKGSIECGGQGEMMKTFQA